ncbi:MAG TPA: glycosyl hydrolase, partial [Chloroflexota bacterium]
MSLDWATDSAQSYAQRLGRSAAVYVAFAQFPTNASEDTYLDQFIDQVRGQGGLALLTLEPRVPLGEITPSMAATFGERLDAYNARGVPVIVRFAHEMNGSWYPWSQQPTDYVRAFRVLAAAVHERARSSAMLWAPNYGAGYPFEDTPGARVAQPGTPDFQVLDTNHDGVLDARDDMYAPYYPGDDAVDWVGMTLYHWGDSWPWGKNVVPEDGKFTAQLTGTYVGAGGDQRGLPNFYQVYAVGHGKPMAIPETAAFYNTSVDGDPELSIKRAWWRQVFSAELARQFPSIKMVNWFEWRKPELEVGNALVDWTATLDPELREAFVADLPVDRLLFGKGPEPQTVDAVPGPPAPAAASGPAPETTSVSAIPDGRRAIEFAGYAWRVRTASVLEGPGPNYFSDSPEHVWLDADGRLHLRVAPEPDGRWYAAEVTS